MSDSAGKQDTEAPGSSAQKKTSLDELSREDLLKKCRSLLAISQKAKQAKDDAVAEMKTTKHELNVRVQESSALRAEVEKLKLRVRTIADEKESVLTAIENVKSNNQELQNLVRSISVERDAFFRDITELNEEKKKLISVVDMMGVENDGTLAEVRSLKDDKRKLNDELFAAISERETFEAEIKEVKLKMVYLLNSSFSILKKFDVDISPTEDFPVESGKTYTGIVCDLISKLDKNLLLLDCNKAEATNKAVDSENNQNFSEIQSKLNSEIELQKSTILTIESQIKSLETVNVGLEEEVKTLKSQTNELLAEKELDNNRLEEFMTQLEESRSNCSKTKREIEHLRDELGDVMEKNKKQSFNAMEMKGVKNENEQIKIAVAEKESEIASLRKELESSHKKLSLQIETLQSAIKEEEKKVLSKQNEIDAVQQELSAANHKLAKSNRDDIVTLESNNKMKVILSELKSELSNARRSFEDRESDVLKLQQQVHEMEISVTDLKNVIAILESLIRDKEDEAKKNEDVSVELAEARRVLEAKEQELTEFKEAVKTKEGVESEHAKLHNELGDVKSDFGKKMAEMGQIIEEHVRAKQELKTQLDAKLDEFKVALDQKESDKSEMVKALANLDEELQSKLSELEEIKSAHVKEMEELQNTNNQLETSKLELANTLKTLEEDRRSESSLALAKLEDELKSKQVEIENILLTHKKEVEELENANRLLEGQKLELENAAKEHEYDGKVEMVAAVTKLEEALKDKKLEIERILSLHKKETEEFQNANHQLETIKSELENALKKIEEDNNSDSVAALAKLEKAVKDKELEIEKILSSHKKETEEFQNANHQLETTKSELENALKKREEDNNSDSLAALAKLDEVLKTKQSEINAIHSAHITQVQELQNAIHTLETSKAELESTLKKHEDSLRTKQQELDEILSTGESESREMSTALSELQRINGVQASEIVTLTSDLQQCRAGIKTMERDFSEQLRLADERDREKRERLSDDLVNVQNTSSETMATLKAVRMELEEIKMNAERNGNQELLAEMNDMNQALKQRGETISKQRELIKELELKLKESEKREASAVQDVASKMAEFEAREKELADLTALHSKAEETLNESAEEIGKLRAKILQLEREIRDHGETASEAMSCSTISRAEESTRLVDMEDSFEDRYTKLRVIAVRLKKRNSELSQQVGSLEAERNKLASDAHNKASQLSSQAKNLQSIQQEYDKAQDLFDARGKELKAALKLSEDASNDAASLKICIDQIKLERDDLLKDIDHCTTSKLALESQVQSLQSQLGAWRREKAEWEAQTQRLTEEVRSAEQRANDEKTRHAKTTDELAVKKQQAKVDTVRCLEMADYERTVEELTQALAAEKAKVAELHGHADTQREIHHGLLEQIRLMAESLEAEGARCTESHEQLHVLRSRLAETSSALSEREAEVLGLKSAVESHRADAEKTQVDMSRLAADQQDKEAEFRDKIARLSQQARHLEDQLSEKSSELLEVSRQLQSVTADFEGYKVRAQSVLRAKTRPEEASDCEEVGQLRRAADSSRARLSQVSAQLESSAAEVAWLQADRDRLLAKCRETADLLTTAEARCQALADRDSASAGQHREALAKQKIHADVLAQGYRAQLDQAREQASADKQRLQDQIDLLESRLLAEKNRIGRVEDRNRIGREEKVSTNSGSSFRRSSPDHLLQLVREEGEGSESVDSLSPHLSSNDRHELMPLEKLLAGGQEDQTHDTNEARTSPDAELPRLRREAALSDRRWRHVTAVLAEAERDRDRLEQLNSALKEEIRRSRRSDEREQHAHNQEYLKNILLKFVTLQSGDERTRLVPVLNTILKLSPEEASHLAAVAKGDQAGGTRGWGSFLWQ